MSPAPQYKDHDDRNYVQANYRRPRNPHREAINSVCDALRGGFSIRTLPLSKADCTVKSVAWLLFRCQVAKDRWRDEFAGLLGLWLIYWRAGYNTERIGDCLGLNRADREWLLVEVRKYIDLGPAPRIARGKVPVRKMKHGVASDIVRRRRLAYKQSQSLKPQQDSPFYTGPTTVI